MSKFTQDSEFFYCEAILPLQLLFFEIFQEMQCCLLRTVWIYFPSISFLG